MSSILLGKPGSGKSYHAVRKIAGLLCDLAKKGENDFRIYTNLSVNIDKLNEYVARETGVKDFASKIVTKVDETFLRFDKSLLTPGDVTTERRGARTYEVINPNSQAWWWQRIPDKTLIVIDELQKYISASKEFGESEKQAITNYMSMHRHKKHEWVAITQRLTAIDAAFRAQIETVYEVFNAKSATIPFPISIPLRDIEMLLKGFGVSNQVYRVRTGTLEGSYKCNWDGGVEVVAMHKEIFDLYSTHTLLTNKDGSTDKLDFSLSENSDTVIPYRMGPGAWRRAIWWFVKKHFLHISLKIVVLFYAFYLLMSVFDFLKKPLPIPTFFDGSGDAAASSSRVSDSEQEQEETDGGSVGGSSPSVVSSDFSMSSDKPTDDEKTDETTQDDESPVFRAVSLFADKILCSDGNYYGIGDAITNCDRLVSVDPREGIKLEPLTREYDRILRQGVLYKKFFDRAKKFEIDVENLEK